MNLLASHLVGRRVFVLIPMLALGVLVLQSTTFRAAANLVRVDVYPTTAGRMVADLTASDFDVLEDGVPQKIESFEHVTISESRIFVVFLDTYFTDIAGSSRMRRSLVQLLDRLVGPNDLFGVMTPDMVAGDITLARRTTTVESFLSKYWFWGQKDALDTIDPVEQEYQACYPRQTTESATAGQEPFDGVAEEMIERRREKRVLDALTDLTKYLRGARDGRKAVIAVTSGWVLLSPNLSLTEHDKFQPTDQRCDRDRISLALNDDRAAYDALIDDANRANVSFYPVNAEGLQVEPLHPRAGDAVLRKRADTLQALAATTDGLAVTGTSNIDERLSRIVDDLSSYYLIGYDSANKTLDGKFRKITVHVKRVGVDVRARRGYRAPTMADVERASASSNVRPAPTAVQVALDDLKAVRRGVPLRVGAGYAAMDPAAGWPRAHLWAFAEIDPEIARHGEWIGGGTIEFTVSARGGETLATRSLSLPGGEHSGAVDLGEFAAPPGETVVHATARASGGGPKSLAETLRLATLQPPGRPLIYRRGASTAMKYVPTADLEFNRTEHVRLDLPLFGTPPAPTAELLDRSAKPMALPVQVTTRTADGVTWLTADVSLAPLAPSTYLIRVKTGAPAQAEVVVGFRLVP